jgi:hypothetical protein
VGASLAVAGLVLAALWFAVQRYRAQPDGIRLADTHERRRMTIVAEREQRWRDGR